MQPNSFFTNYLLPIIASACLLPATVFTRACRAAENEPENPQIKNEWIDAVTGHRVIRLSRREGSNSAFYFHDNPFYKSGGEDWMLFYGTTAKGRCLFTVNLKTLQIRQLTDFNARVMLAPKQGEIFYQRGKKIYAMNLETSQTRLVVELPQDFPGQVYTINSDETLLAGCYAEGIASYFKKPRSVWFGEIFDAHLLNHLFTIDIRTGEIKEIHHENTWLGHVQFSPTDPHLLMFCHEGPWQKLHRIWLINTDGTGLKKIHPRTVKDEIAGHEFWDPAGKRIFFDLQIPRGQNFYLAASDIKSGKEIRYPLSRNQWSYHYNISPDGKLFCGDGGGRKSVAAAPDGKWIYLFRPKSRKLHAERLCNLADHDYKLEPCVHFSPDAGWVIFHSNMHGTSQVYAVEVRPAVKKSDVANYYPLLKDLADESPLLLSYLSKDWLSLQMWQNRGRLKMQQLLRYDREPVPLNPQITESMPKDGYTRHRVCYTVADDRKTEAFLLIPDNLQAPAPAVVALHDHGGFYYFGKEKITQTENPPEVLQSHIDTYYGGRTFADELARRGFVVLAPDAFYFGYQRIIPEQLSDKYLPDNFNNLAPGSDQYIRTCNAISGKHEELTAKTIFTAGTTWPGILFQGDRASVDYLLTRPEVDPGRIGCVGLSLGGFRSAHLFGLDARIKAGVVAGWMTTYKSLLQNHLWCHTWMIYVPGQYRYLDLPDVATLNAPRPLMVINCLKDILFPLQGMKDAENKIAAVYQKLNAGENFQCNYYDQPHSFKIPAQNDAIAFLEKHLK